MSSYLLDYPFADRLYPAAIEVLKRLGSVGPTVLLSDGDAVFQPRKVERAGLSEAVDGRVLIYIHKEEELADIERRYPAEHYVLVDDKPRILAAVKPLWGERVTTVLPRQGIYAHDPSVVDAFPPADVTIERIGDLLDVDLPRLSPLMRGCGLTSAGRSRRRRCAGRRRRPDRYDSRPDPGASRSRSRRHRTGWSHPRPWSPRR